MLKTWRLINSGPQDPLTNMATDEALLLAYRPGISVPTLRLYEWRNPSFSIGFSQDPDKLLLRGDVVRRPSGRIHDFPVVRRPTGGGLLWHKDEITYSFVADTRDMGLTGSIKESYAFITAFVLKTLEALGLKASFARDAEGKQAEKGLADYCYSRHEEYDICIDGKKIGGHAQKRRRRTFLQHGSLPLTLDTGHLSDACCGLEPTDTKYVTSLAEAAGRAFTRTEVHQALAEAFTRHFGVLLKEGPLSREEIQQVKRLQDNKYTHSARNRKSHDPSLPPAGVAA